MVQPSPHSDQKHIRVGCAVVTVSDTRSVETDHSGHLLKQLLRDSGHLVKVYVIVRDEPAEIQEQLRQFAQYPDLDTLILNGGTGISPRDTTYEAIEKLLEKKLPGFGELFRFFSYQEIGSRAIASRAVAGVYHGKLIFSLPGSLNAVKLATEKLILPELSHLVLQLRKAD